jgi:predicted SnoaL-like aldol condensation-catalyzing enzyme
MRNLLLFITAGSLFFACTNHATSKADDKAHSDSMTAQIGMLKAVNQQLENNKKMVADMYQQLFGDKDTSAIDKYIAEGYIQHNPYVADGRKALKEATSKWFKNAPKEKIDIVHLGADGNYVYIHTRSKSGGKTVSVIDIFRIDNNKIVEHWDVMQEVPAKAANDHPMF